MTWPGFHDLRHYRATQWIRHGVDIRTVKEWLGHKDIATTMLYLRFVEGHAEAKFREAEKAELLELAEVARKWRQINPISVSLTGTQGFEPR